MLLLLKESKKKIGRCRIHIEPDTESEMIGWLLLKKEWRKGYATEITEALLQYFFNTLNVHRVYALCHPENMGSRRVPEKCNMRKEAHYKENFPFERVDIASEK